MSAQRNSGSCHENCGKFICTKSFAQSSRNSKAITLINKIFSISSTGSLLNSRFSTAIEDEYTWRTLTGNFFKKFHGSTSSATARKQFPTQQLHVYRFDNFVEPFRPCYKQAKSKQYKKDQERQN